MSGLVGIVPRSVALTTVAFGEGPELEPQLGDPARNATKRSSSNPRSRLFFTGTGQQTPGQPLSCMPPMASWRAVAGFDCRNCRKSSGGLRDLLLSGTGVELAALLQVVQNIKNHPRIGNA